MRKVHIHTDCAFFAGCENMVAALLNHTGLNKMRISADSEHSFRSKLNIDFGRN